MAGMVGMVIGGFIGSTIGGFGGMIIGALSLGIPLMILAMIVSSNSASNAPLVRIDPATGLAPGTPTWGPPAEREQPVQADAKSDDAIADRLKRLEGLFESGTISADELKARREAILAEI